MIPFVETIPAGTSREFGGITALRNLTTDPAASVQFERGLALPFVALSEYHEERGRWRSVILAAGPGHDLIVELSNEEGARFAPAGAGAFGGVVSGSVAVEPGAAPLAITLPGPVEQIMSTAADLLAPAPVGDPKYVYLQNGSLVTNGTLAGARANPWDRLRYLDVAVWCAILATGTTLTLSWYLYGCAKGSTGAPGLQTNAAYTNGSPGFSTASAGTNMFGDAFMLAYELVLGDGAVQPGSYIGAHGKLR